MTSTPNFQPKNKEKSSEKSNIYWRLLKFFMKEHESKIKVYSHFEKQKRKQTWFESKCLNVIYKINQTKGSFTPTIFRRLRSRELIVQ